MQTSIEKLNVKFNKGLHVCVGLDTDINKIPKHFLRYSDPVFEFNKTVIENTADETAAFKINFAFYERDGAKGIENLSRTKELIPNDVFTIADAKRGDIGNTSQMYAESVFDHLNFDSVTLHPYMGYDSLSPFLNYQNKFSFILALTSNPGSADFEKLQLSNGRFLFQEIIEKVKSWNSNNNCGIVFGATNEIELQENVANFAKLPVLVPGVGTQGGNLKKIKKIFQNQAKLDYLINISRNLLYCDGSEKFPETLKKVLGEYNETIRNVSE